MITKKYSKTKPVCKVSFSLTTEQVGKGAEVRVLGDFNDWSWDKGLAMKAKKGAYEASLELPAGSSYQFRYLVNGHTWLNDEAADDYQGTPFFSHNCIIHLEAVATKPAAKKSPAKARKAPAKKASAPKKKASTPKKAATVTADKLTTIEGIGPKIAEHLSNAGITTFAQLGKASKAKLQGVLDAAGPRYRMHDPSTWAKQAKLAASGKWEELKSLQAELKGGRAKK
jgi:predicted flap endonuclease-1-like 5' DNA nuclease